MRKLFLLHLLAARNSLFMFSCCLCWQAIRPDALLVAVHDSARPLMRPDDVARCIVDASEVSNRGAESRRGVSGC